MPDRDRHIPQIESAQFTAAQSEFAASTPFQGIIIEELDTPEMIVGGSFRVPSIIGEGSGRGFKLDGLQLPFEWDTAAVGYSEKDGEFRYELFNADCERNGLQAGKMVLDRNTGLLMQLMVHASDSEASVGINSNWDLERGNYSSSRIYDIQSAILLQRQIALYLSGIASKAGIEQDYPYIDGGNGVFYSQSLAIPQFVLEADALVMGDYGQQRFREQASNIAGRFGLSLKHVAFDDRGIPQFYQIAEGSACQYYLDRRANDGVYLPHNVDTAYQAGALHTIGAAFINSTLADSRFHDTFS
jgi:hypothetical protein